MNHTMSEKIKLAQKILTEPSNINDVMLEKILNNVLKHSIDYADLYFQNISNESWVLEDGIVKDGGYNIDSGVGIRAISGEKVGFAYSDDIIMPALEEISTAARGIATLGGKNNIKAWNKNKDNNVQNFYGIDNPLTSIPDSEKISLLQKTDQIARKADPKIKQVIVSLAGSYSVVFIVSSDGQYVADIRPLVRFNVSVIAQDGKRIEKGSTGGGGRYTYKELIEKNVIEEYALDATRQALILLDAKPAPAGAMPVVLGSGWPGVLLHEAVGHGLEGDFIRKESSAFTNKIGQKVASSVCTVVDNGTLDKRRGSLNIDDEGTLTQNTTLIENGILKCYMQDKHNARLMNQKSTGNGRRESYAYLTVPRMTNTYMLPGKYKPEEIIKTVKKGLYAVNFGGGQVDITSGKFVFNASEAYIIENGKIKDPVKGATLIGNGPDVLTKVRMVGDDLKMDNGVGVCGKDGQGVPVGVGQPTLLIDEITVGGTQ